MSTVSLWQRRHQPDVIAEVTPIPGMGTWAVCAYREPGRRDVHEGTRFGLLTEAHIAADALAASALGHVCGPACGVWLRVERRSSGPAASRNTTRRRAADA